MSIANSGAYKKWNPGDYRRRLGYQKEVDGKAPNADKFKIIDQSTICAKTIRLKDSNETGQKLSEPYFKDSSRRVHLSVKESEYTTDDLKKMSAFKFNVIRQDLESFKNGGNASNSDLKTYIKDMTDIYINAYQKFCCDVPGSLDGDIQEMVYEKLNNDLSGKETKSSKSIGNDTDVKLEVTNDTNVKLEVTLDTLNNIISSCFKTQMCGGFILEEGLDRHQAMKTLQGSVDRVKEQKGVRFSEESITDVEAYATKNGGKGVCIGGSFMVSSFNDNVIIEEEVNEAKTETKTTTKDIYNLKPKVNEKDAKGNEITSLPATTKTFKLGNNINVMKYHASSGTGEAGKDKLNRMLFLDTTGEFLEEGKNNVIMADANFDVLSTNNLEELISFAKEKNVKFAIPPHKIIKQRYLANPLLNNQMGKFEQKEAESKIIAFTGETCHFESNAAIVIDGKKTKEEVVTEIQSSKKAFSKDVPLDHFIFKGHLNVDGQDVYFEDSNDMSITDKRKGIKEKNPFSGKRDLVECLGRYIAIKLLDYERGVESQ